MAKILITPLGTGRYEIDKNGKKQLGYLQTIYQFDDSESVPTKLISKAIYEKYDIDKIYIIGTMKSIWDEIFNEYSKNNYNEEIHYKLMEQCESASKDTPLDKDKFKFFEEIPHIEPILIYYGVNQNEIEESQKILMAMFNEIAQAAGNEPIELHIDITHSFRSLSFFIFNFLIYIKELVGDRVTITHVHYGMLELGSEMSKKIVDGTEYNVAPIIDLSGIYGITKMTQAVGEFKKYGYGYTLADLTDDPQLKEKVKNFTDVVNLQYISQIKDQLPSLVNLIKSNAKLNHSMENEIVQRVLGDFTKSFNFDLDNRPDLVLINLADWYCKSKRYGQAICNIE